MTAGQVERIASLLRERNALDERIGAIIQRPMISGHLGEWVAAPIFGIELAASAVEAGGIDGRFRARSLRGWTVNVKWYLKREGLLDFTESPVLDYHLVLTGPTSPALSSSRCRSELVVQRRKQPLTSGGERHITPHAVAMPRAGRRRR